MDGGLPTRVEVKLERVFTLELSVCKNSESFENNDDALEVKYGQSYSRNLVK